MNNSVERLEAELEAGIQAVQIVINNWDSGDLARSVRELEDWATNAADLLPD